LVSVSTLAVSFAFAFGPSVAKNVEGILLIAVRRPYDIGEPWRNDTDFWLFTSFASHSIPSFVVTGDRITICSAEAVSNPTPTDTWLVEDISLTTTTMRYAATNEVATSKYW
jgi:small-conductance mechanosensitive channel